MERSSTVPDSEPPRAPDLPDLEIVRHIGSGGYGHVWLARNRVTGALLGVKTIHLEQDEAGTRTVREIGALIRMEAEVRSPHENLLTIHHVGRTDDVVYYTMDPADDVSGKPASTEAPYRPSTLGARLQDGPLNPEACLQCARQLLEGVTHLHEKGLAHRDIKPANCLFINGTLKLADFGLVTQAEGSASVVGTRPYMPPDGHMDARADVYAAGLVIYEMLTGLPATAFPRWSREAVETARRSPVVKHLNRIVLKACQADRNQRYSDAREMLADIQEPPKANRWKTRRKAVMAGTILGALVLAGGAVGLIFGVGGADRANVNFITHPFEAQIFLNGERADRDDGNPYTTPCTIPGLPREPHEVVFKLPGRQELEVGSVDFAHQQEIVADWDQVEQP